MRVSHSNTYLDKRGRRYRKMSLAQRAQLRKDYIAHVPTWRRAPIGYFAAFLLVTLITVSCVYFGSLLGYSLLPSSLFIFSILVIALFWGAGSAIFDLLLSIASLKYYFVTPNDQIYFNDWREVVQLIPFVVAGLVIALMTAQRERARLQALAAEQELQAYAEELEETNHRLEDANQMKDKFISIASHELKTPVTTIRGQAQLMLRRISKQKNLSDLDGFGQALERINTQTSRLTVLIDDLLEASSVRAGKTNLNRKLCDISLICQDVVDEQRFLTGRTLQLQMSDQSMMISIDADRVSQVLTNLISNAAKYSSEKEPIEVSINKNEKSVCMQVKDHGSGIDKNHLEYIFDTFYRTPDAQSSSKRGLGLGLSISKDIVERHNGRIWCESIPGQGSTFYVELPIVTH